MQAGMVLLFEEDGVGAGSPLGAKLPSWSGRSRIGGVFALGTLPRREGDCLDPSLLYCVS